MGAEAQARSAAASTAASGPAPGAAPAIDSVEADGEDTDAAEGETEGWRAGGERSLDMGKGSP